MVRERPYRAAMTHEEAIAEIVECSGSQFDPVVVEAFLEIFTENPEPPRAHRAVGAAPA